MKGMNFLYLLCSILFMMALFIVKGVRWQLLLAPMQEMKFKHVFSPLMIGYFVHNILPFRMGELARIYYLNRNETLSKTSILGSIIAEKFFDGIALVLLVLLTIPFHLGIEESNLIRAIQIFFLIIVSGAIFYFIAKKLSHRFLNPDGKKINPLKNKLLHNIISHIQKFLHGFKALDSFKITGCSSLQSICIYLLDSLSLYMLLLSFGVQQDNLLFKCIIPIIIINIGIMVPSGPGDIGMFHYVGKLALMETFFLDVNVASSIIILFNFVSILPGFVLGGYFMFKAHIRIDLEKIKNE